MFFYYTPLHDAVEKGNLSIVQLLMKNPKIDVNCKSVLNYKIFKFNFKIFNFFNFISKKNLDLMAFQ